MLLLKLKSILEISNSDISGKKKPYKDKDGKHNEEERCVMSQPLMYGDAYNLRKLNNLPYHLNHAGDVEALKEKCLSNYEFLQHKMLATSCRYWLSSITNCS